MRMAQSFGDSRIRRASSQPAGVSNAWVPRVESFSIGRRSAFRGSSQNAVVARPLASLLRSIENEAFAPRYTMIHSRSSCARGEIQDLAGRVSALGEDALVRDQAPPFFAIQEDLLQEAELNGAWGVEGFFPGRKHAPAIVVAVGVRGPGQVGIIRLPPIQSGVTSKPYSVPAS